MKTIMSQAVLVSVFIIYLLIYPAAMTSFSIVHKLFESLLQSFKSRIIYIQH